MNSLFYFLISLFASAAMAPRQDFLTVGPEKIEYFWAQPDGSGPFPVLVLLHPDQDSPKGGGKSFVDSGQLKFWADKGYVAVAPSQPGYGGSTGSADFCGPETQKAVLEVIKFFQQKSFIDPKHFFVYGGSRGAVVASLLATQDLKITGYILKSGVYDFTEFAKLKPWHDEVKFGMFLEIGWLTDQKLRERSAFFQAEKIRTPMLVIHGASDPRAPLKIAEAFAKKAKAQFLKLEAEHLIPMPDIAEHLEKFMKEQP